MLPEHSPYTSEQRAALENAISGFTPEQRAWLSGFLAQAGGSAVPAEPAAGGRMTVLYGSESGNSEELADRTAKEARRRGFKVVLKSMADVAPGNLVEAENLLVIVSTWGDGEPPESAESCFN
ncbi:MAG: flavodoxin domain-containing protein [Verrucomicrobiales bacterium]